MLSHISSVFFSAGRRISSLSQRADPDGLFQSVSSTLSSFSATRRADSDAVCFSSQASSSFLIYTAVLSSTLSRGAKCAAIQVHAALVSNTADIQTVYPNRYFITSDMLIYCLAARWIGLFSCSQIEIMLISAQSEVVFSVLGLSCGWGSGFNIWASVQTSDKGGVLKSKDGSLFLASCLDRWVKPEDPESPGFIM